MRSNISVCIATYNGEKYIREQLESILIQLSPDDEIVISDDSSTDTTLDIIYSFNDHRIKVFPCQKYKNPIFNFENALKLASNEIIFLSDQDDIWVENKVERMIHILLNYDLVVCDCSFIDKDGSVILESYFEKVKSSPGVFKNLMKNTYFGCCMAFKREVLKKALPFPNRIPMHDIWLGVVADLFYKSFFLKEQLTLYRRHSQNASIASEIVSKKSIWTKLNYRLNILRYLPSLLTR